MKINSNILLTILFFLLGYQVTSYSIAEYNGTPYDQWKITMHLEVDEELKIGDKIDLYSGYFKIPEYLDYPPTHIHEGEVVDFILGRNNEKATVIRLDRPVAGDSLTGNFVVMELKYESQTWSSTGPVHLELCDFKPLNRSWKDRRKGEWFEPTASFKIKDTEARKSG